MDKTFLKRGMASALSMVMALSTAVPSSVVYAAETATVNEIAQDLVATLGKAKNGKVSFVSGGNKITDPTTHLKGDKVEIAAEPAEGFNTAKIEIKNADGKVVASLENGKVTEKNGAYSFEMPDTNVTVNVDFEAEPVAVAETEEETEATVAVAETEEETEATESEKETEVAETETEEATEEATTEEATEVETEKETEVKTETETEVETETETATETEAEEATEAETEEATEEKVQIFG